MTRTLLLALALLTLPVAAHAQSEGDSWYFDLRGGLNYLTDSDITVSGVPGSIEAEFDPGYAVQGAVGYEHSSGFRGELEIGYRDNSLDAFQSGGVSVPAGTLGLDYDVSALSVMANGYYAFDTGTGFKPFIGAGIGAAVLNADLSFLGVSESEDSTEFAYQGIVGIEYEIPTDSMTIGLGLRYVYFATTDPEFDGVETEYSSHNILAGIRFSR